MARDLFAAALEYRMRGWHTFPLKPGTKFPAIKEWQKRATTDLSLLHLWFDIDVGQNIAIATGRISGLFVIDIDVKNGVDGEATLRALEITHGKLPVTYEVRTPSGGRHLYFAYPKGDIEFRNDAGKRFGPGIDIRADGGYVVAPPSILMNVGDYSYGSDIRWLAQ